MPFNKTVESHPELCADGNGLQDDEADDSFSI